MAAVFVRHLSIFWQMLKADFKVISKDIFSATIDTAFWVALSIFANGLILPVLGVSKDYGILVALGAIVSVGAFETYSNMIALVGDYIGDRAISYDLILPIPAWLVFLKIAISRMLRFFVLASVVLPLSKIILYNSFDFSFFSWWKFPLAYFAVGALSCGSVILASSIPDGLHNVERVWVRYIFPLWYLGGSLFPLQAMINAFPKLSVLFLLNPVVYSTEVVRAALLDQSGYYLPFWLSFTMTMFFAVVFFCVGYFRLKKRLDFI